MPNLRVLSLSFVHPPLTDALLTSTLFPSSICQTLAVLYLRGAVITDATVAAIAQHCQFIEMLALTRCHLLTDQSLLYLIDASLPPSSFLPTMSTSLLTSRSTYGVLELPSPNNSRMSPRASAATPSSLSSSSYPRRFSASSHPEVKSSNPSHSIHDDIHRTLTDGPAIRHSLRLLDVGQCPLITDAPLARLSLRCPLLATIRVNDCKITPGVVDDHLQPGFIPFVPSYLDVDLHTPS
jgi:hypothetical protein